MKLRMTAMLLALAMLAAMFTGCGHQHTWEEATCTEPQTCSECGKTEGERLGHDWIEATCTEPETCARCGKTKGEALGHEWTEATCTEAAACTRCGETDGEPAGHVWEGGSCTEPATCSVCGTVSDEPAGHDFSEPNYQSAAVCSVCGAVEGDPLPAVYDTCGITMNVESSGEEAFEYTTVCEEDTTKETKGYGSMCYVGLSDDVDELADTVEYARETYGGGVDVSSMLKDGYVWQLVTGAIGFYDANFKQYGAKVTLLNEDYYDPAARDQSVKVVSAEDNLYSYTVNFNGIDYTDCLVTFYGSWTSDDGVDMYTYYIWYMVPEGYDGTVTGLISAGVDWPEGQYIFDIDLSTALMMRLPAAQAAE